MKKLIRMTYLNIIPKEHAQNIVLPEGTIFNRIISDQITLDCSQYLYDVAEVNWLNNEASATVRILYPQVFDYIKEMQEALQDEIRKQR